MKQPLSPITEETPEGTPVILVDDHGRPWLTKTRSPVWALGHGEQVVLVEGKAGGYKVERIFVLGPGSE